ncbi:class I SAM-dependent methyltransferase [Streptomyces sp. NBC_00658]|uniref:class I SAM-dependent methyltransferase n=1 Tax=Streptomyces sp. NBC_00658 TaxID=2975800 RepID=UPI00324C6018
MSQVWNPSKGGTPSVELADLSRTRRFQSVLDAGCGWGRNISVFAAGAQRLHAFDTDPEGVQATKERLEEVSAADAEVQVWDGDLLTTEPDAPYDLVICYGVTHFLRRAERTVAYERLKSWARPGGLVAVASFNALVPIPADLLTLMPEPPADSGELREAFADLDTVFARSHVYNDEHDGGIHHTHSIDRLIFRMP